MTEQSWVEAAARWHLVIAAASLAFAPLVRWLCAGLSDRGATVVRPVALLLAVYPGWLLASLGVARFGVAIVVVPAAIAALLGWLALARSRSIDRPWLTSLARVELASLALFAAYLWLRGFTPEILGTEKPMDVAFLSSSVRTTVVPPPDPWFAGQPINYYYLGYLLHGTVSRVAGVQPQVGFNLALATIFSMTALAAFGAAWNAVRPWLGRSAALAAGVIAAFLIALSGNLYAPARLLLDWSGTRQAWWWDSATGIGWRSSRIVCDGPRVGNLCPPPATETINEFPFFSFLLGDLHPHVMALPYTLVAVLLAWNLARLGPSPLLARETVWLPRLIVTGGIVGALYALNAWDFPTYLGLTILAVIGVATHGLGRAVRSSAVLLLSAILAWLPFFLTYDTPTNPALAGLPAWAARLPGVPILTSALAVHIGERTSIVEYLTIFGVPYAFGLALLAHGIWRGPGADVRPELRPLLIATVGAVIPGVLLSAPLLPLCGIPLTLAVDQLLRDRSLGPRTFALAAYTAAWALSIAVEFVYIRDAFDDRMNTLFKFYYQAWSLSALGAATAIAVLWAAAAGVAWRRAALSGAVAMALLAGLAYPIVASHQWTGGFAGWEGLDGLAYGEQTEPDDVAAIRWLAHHAGPGDVVLEAAGCSYRPFGRLPFNRVAAFTGIPAVIGWGDNHQRQWRASQPELIAEIGARQDDVAAMFANPASPLLDSYGVTWLFVGEYESGSWQTECPTAGPYAGLGSPGYPGPGWEEAFRSGETRVFRAVDSG